MIPSQLSIVHEEIQGALQFTICAMIVRWLDDVGQETFAVAMIVHRLSKMRHTCKFAANLTAHKP